MGNNDWLDIEVLDDYLEGKLDASAMHKVERISLDDPFVAQALAGLAENKRRTQDLSILQKRLQERVAEKPVERKVWRLVSHRLSIAATAAVLFITVSILFWMRESNRQKDEALAARKASGVEVAIAPNADNKVIDVQDLAAVPTLSDSQVVEKALQNTIANGTNAVAITKKTNSAALIAPEIALQSKEVDRVLVDAQAKNTEINATEPAMAAAAAVSNDQLQEVAVVSAAHSMKKSAPVSSVLSGKVAGLNVSKSFTDGEPIVGKTAYGKYLSENNKLLTDSSKVAFLVFKVSTDGTPVEITIIKTAGKDFDDEAIRLLKTGGKWKVPTDDGKFVNIQIRF